jgi:hypothetical protein
VTLKLLPPKWPLVSIKDGLITVPWYTFFGDVNKEIEARRLKLRANTTYYVSATGSDTTGNGAVGRPWRTKQKAYDWIVANVDFGGFTVTIQLVNSTAYTDGLLIAVAWTGGGILKVAGNNATPTNVRTNVTSGDVYEITCSLPGELHILDQELRTTTGGNCIDNFGNNVKWGNLVFGACAGSHIVDYTSYAGMECIGNYTISGNAQSHWTCGANAELTIQDKTITLSGTPAFSSAFAVCGDSGVLTATGLTFSGSATGARYSLYNNGIFVLGTNSLTYFPGSTTGFREAGSIYNTASGVSAWKNGTDQTGVVAFTPTQITFGTEIYDRGARFASNAWTPGAGPVTIAAGVQFNATNLPADNGSTIYVYKNASPFKYAGIHVATTASVVLPTISIVDEANDTDVYTIFADAPGTTSNLTVEGAGGGTWFMGQQL